MQAMRQAQQHCFQLALAIECWGLTASALAE